VDEEWKHEGVSTFGCCFLADQLKFGSVVSLLSTKLTVNNVIGVWHK